MARETYAALQAKIEKEINKLQKKAEVLQTKRRKPVITSIITSMREYDITPEEIIAAYGSGKPARVAPGGRRKAGAAARPATAAKRAVAPKYRHPQTGETWSGRGKAPRWLAAEEAGGATRDSFLIKE
ncbi:MULTISPECIES: H-NS histone family protein [Achromobacter]|jgi:DNA-binding protein H-NS|uniref:DNA-binding protein n=1 Tax=Achromobacter spanius TaxID=217203 RepID=A0A2S5GVE3_9BURK|nr:MULTISPECIES: H-NS histone family protein [Achromobacter]AYD63810.1 H-NS histone family protein [Achromobacter sp. B7]MDX3988249.1 H-NS histone family protein [Achromobacter sp.]PPA76926.1 DNA-binding protein [Achromobacter spanius]QYJ23188.1 H-NS histone family protein [Achromobacter sp. ES-001]HCQ49523.1 H-NS histone family protein [Achromobacter sp.]